VSTKHTPRPWKVGKGSFVIADSPAPGIHGSNMIEHYGGHLICESVSEANAHLIAAAPDLLEALEKCLYIIGHPKDEPETLWRTDDEINDAYMQARAAIAKAKGGQP